MRDGRAAAHAVVEVHAGAGAVVGNIAVDRVPEGLALEVEGVLLGVEPDLVDDVADHLRAARLVAGRGVEAHARDGAAVRVAPLRDGRLADADELVVRDACVPRVAADEDGVAVEALQQAAADGGADRALEEERARAADGPVSSRWRPVRPEVIGRRVSEGDAEEADSDNRLGLRARGVDEHGQHRRDDGALGRRRRAPRRVVPEVELLGGCVVVELAGRVELVQEVLNEELLAGVAAARALVAALCEGEVELR